VEKNGVIRVIQCACGAEFTALRSDAKFCKACHYRRQKTWATANSHRRKEAHKQRRLAAFAGYGGACACCGESRYEFLAIDHVHGGGRVERTTLSTNQIAKKVIDLGFPPEYRVLCHNCNSAIGWFGYCPHSGEVKRTA
jgi:hypothetical protein